MTLLIAISNRSFAAILGDRRIVAGRKVVDDETNKVCVLFCDDARMVVGYAGFAGVNRFKTQDWLRDSLGSISEKKCSLNEILEEFTKRATATFRKLSKQIATVFLFSGFHFLPQPTNCAFEVTNWNRQSYSFFPGRQFRLLELGNPGQVTVEAAGYLAALSKQHKDSLAKMLQHGNPEPEVLRKAVSVIRQIARDPKSKGYVGIQCNSGVVPCTPDTWVTGTYHSARANLNAYGPDIVIGVSDGKLLVTGMKLSAGLILSGPTIRKSEPCWCGSGKRFGKCHLKKFGSVYTQLAGFKKPMMMVCLLKTKTRHLTGASFGVCSSFT